MKIFSFIIRLATMLVISAASFCPAQLFAQTENLIFRNITPDDGLPATTVVGINQDAYGYIWFGTWYGVYRYDGNTFEKKSEMGRYVIPDKKGGVWISYNRTINGTGTIAYYDSKADSLTLYEYKGWENSFPEIILDASGTLWASSENGLYYFNKSNLSFEKDTLAQAEFGHIELVAHENGSLSFFYLEPGVKWGIGHRSENGTVLYEDFPLDLNNPDPTLPINVSSVPRMVGYMHNGILLINEYGWAYKETFSSDWTFVKPDRDDILPTRLLGRSSIAHHSNLYVRHDNALMTFDIESGASVTYRHNPLNPKSILPTDDVFAHLFIDRQDVLWVPSFAYGFSRLNLYESDFGLLRFEDGTPVRDVISALELEDGSFWVGSRIEENGLLHFDAEGNIIQRYSRPFDSPPGPPGRSVSDEISHPFVWSLAVGSDGSFWAGTGSPDPNSGGLNRIRPGSDEITRFKHDPSDDASLYSGSLVRDLFEDGSGRIWFQSFTQTAWIDPKTEIITRYQHPANTGLEEDEPFFMMKTDDGDLMASSRNNVYYRIHHEDLSTEIIDLNHEWHEHTGIRGQDMNGRFWVMNSTGFGMLDSSLTSIETWYDIHSISIPVTEFSALQIDDENNIWLQSDNGLIRFDPSKEEVTHYTYERGLQGYTFSGRVNYKGPSGKLYFGDNGGINIFDPSQIQVNPHPPEMVFTKVTLDGNDISLEPDQSLATLMQSGEAIPIQPDISTLGFEFAALHFAGDKSNTYQFKLDGFDADWRESGTIGQATYTNLTPGEYTFRIKGSNLDGIWSDGSTSIVLRVLPPWYQTWWAYGFYFILLITGIVMVDRIQRKRVQQKEREKAREKELAQAKEIEKAYQNLEVAHENLKSAQDQLVQQEKLASLGQLTAGIAHEIKNPLNFVNNFSEVSIEMVDEVREEVKRQTAKVRSESVSPKDAGMSENIKPQNQDLILEILDDIETNLRKIYEHGSRADGIVKSMLQHSRGGTGRMEPTNLNAVIKEYVNLSFHGMRAAKEPINVDIDLQLDETIGNVNLVTEDFSRVIVNLCNNAFDAMREKMAAVSNQPPASYLPTLTVRTKSEGNTIVVEIEDNGPGIPQELKDKILQPFFTTKKGKDGTGLGLSITNDIIKAHRGEMEITSEQNKFTNFKIILSK